MADRYVFVGMGWLRQLNGPYLIAPFSRAARIHIIATGLT